MTTQKLDRFETLAAAIEYLKNEKGCASSSAAMTYLYDHLPKESHYQKKIIGYLKKRYPAAFVWKAAAGPYNRQGIPDVCAIIDGRYFGFEVKRPLVGVLSKIQKETIRKIREAGGVAAVVSFAEEAERIVEETLHE